MGRSDICINIIHVKIHISPYLIAHAILYSSVHHDSYYISHWCIYWALAIKDRALGIFYKLYFLKALLFETMLSSEKEGLQMASNKEFKAVETNLLKLCCIWTNEVSQQEWKPLTMLVVSFWKKSECN